MYKLHVYTITYRYRRYSNTNMTTHKIVYIKKKKREFLIEIEIIRFTCNHWEINGIV